MSFMGLEDSGLPKRQFHKIARLPKKPVRTLVVNTTPSIRYVSRMVMGHARANRITGSLCRPQTKHCRSRPNWHLDLATLE